MNQPRCGYVAIIGRPNVGKSTLLNRLLGQKISITSPKPQTTRHRLLGIKTEGETQIIYVDTPGIHAQAEHAMNRILNRTAISSITGTDLVLWLVEALRWTAEDEKVLRLLRDCDIPLVLAVNKVDKITDKCELLPFLQSLSEKRQFNDIFPISALREDNLENLEQWIIAHLPLGAHQFPEEQVTDRSERFLVAEIVREKLTRRLDAELPYRLNVGVDYFKVEGHLIHISAVIWVEREGQKSIVIGKKGEMLKIVGSEARRDIEILLDSKVFLQLWVKVKEGWYNDERTLRHLGYFDE